MTIKKIGLSALAATMMASSAVAGTLTLDSNATSVASELLVDNNATLGTVGIQAEYTPSLTAGVQDGKLLVTFEGGTITEVPTGFVRNIDTNKTVGLNPQLAGQNSQKLIFDLNDTVNDYNQLKLVADTVLGTDTNMSIKLKMISANGITMKMELLDNVDDSLDISDIKTLASTETEWDVKVGSTVFDALIDAAGGFLNFTTDGANSQSSDYSLITVTNNSVDQNTTDLDLNVTLISDTNLTTMVSTMKLNGSNMSAAGINAAGQYTFTGSIANITGAGDYNITLDSNGSAVLAKTDFQVSVSSDNVGGNANFAGTYLTKAPFGEWGIYGYSAQIPNVRTKDGVYDTYVNITNTSAISADAVFTILPKVDGSHSTEDDTCTYNAGSIPKNSQSKYNFKDILAASDCSEAVKSSVNFSVELAVPTKPNDVYVNAYTKNSSINDFIVLPVYNTSDNSY